MTPEPPFEPTLEVPLAWIRELAGGANGAPEVLSLSYLPHHRQQAEELGYTLDDIESDLQNGYSFSKKEGDRGSYYILRSERFAVFVTPQLGRTSATPLAVITKIDPHPEPRQVGRGPLPIKLAPIWEEQPASPEALLSYQASMRPLASPPPIDPRAPKPKPDETEGLWRYSALAELLRLLRRRVEHAPRLRLACTVLRTADDGLGDEDSDAPLRLETTQPLRGWRPETPVTAYIDNKAAFTSRVRDIEGQVIELDPPDVPAVPAGTPVTLEQLPRFAMAAHQRALDLFLRREVAGNWSDLRDFLAAPENLVPGETLVAEEAEEPSTSAERLTPEQRRAVERAISTPHAFFIQGPPGTGKTTVITEIVQRLVRRGERVLLLSNTHVAVDEVLRRIDKKDDVLPVRLTWSTAKVDPEVRKYAYEHAVSGLVEKVLRPRQDRQGFWSYFARGLVTGSGEDVVANLLVWGQDKRRRAAPQYQAEPVRLLGPGTLVREWLSLTARFGAEFRGVARGFPVIDSPRLEALGPCQFRLGLTREDALRVAEDRWLTEPLPMTIRSSTAKVDVRLSLEPLTPEAANLFVLDVIARRLEEQNRQVSRTAIMEETRRARERYSLASVELVSRAAVEDRLWQMKRFMAVYSLREKEDFAYG